MQKTIIVLGMHRSGTSLLAEAVSRWGAYAGPAKDLIQAAKSNSRGFWEFEPLVSLNNMLLASVDSDWSLPPPEGGEALLERRASEECLKIRASYLISRMEAAGKPWFWKDPRLCILLPFWRQFLDASVVITIRKPAEVALSLYKRNGLPTSAGLLLWQYYMRSILMNTESMPNKIFVEYEELAAGCEDEFRRLSGFLDASCGVDGASEERLKSMMSVAASALNHNKSDASNACCELTDAQQRLQKILEAKRSNAQVCRGLNGCELYPGWREYLEVCYVQRALSRAV